MRRYFFGVTVVLNVGYDFNPGSTVLPSEPVSVPTNLSSPGFVCPRTRSSTPPRSPATRPPTCRCRTQTTPRPRGGRSSTWRSAPPTPSGWPQRASWAPPSASSSRRPPCAEGGLECRNALVRIYRAMFLLRTSFQ